jgi:hypothetical protein
MSLTPTFSGGSRLLAHKAVVQCLHAGKKEARPHVSLNRADGDKFLTYD